MPATWNQPRLCRSRIPSRRSPCRDNSINFKSSSAGSACTFSKTEGFVANFLTPLDKAVRRITLFRRLRHYGELDGLLSREDQIGGGQTQTGIHHSLNARS